MRRLTVVQLLPALDPGGAERSTLEIAAALVAAGHRAVVIAAGGAWVPRLEALGAEFIALDLKSKSLRALTRAGALRRALIALEPDIVHARSRLPAWLGWRALAGLPKSRPAFVTTVHGLNSPGWYSGIMTRGERVICVSRTALAHVRQHWPQVSPSRLVLIPRGLDPRAFNPAPPPPRWRAELDVAFPALAGRGYALLPARGTRLKNHADAIAALARLVQTHRIDAALLLAGVIEPGRAAYVAELQRLAGELGVADRVAYSPARDDVQWLLAQAAVVMQTSAKPESFGRSVIEALAMHTPIVGYAHGGVGELLDELYPEGAVAPFDVAALAAHAAALWGRQIELIVPPKYTLDAMQQATLALYADLAGERRTRVSS